MQSKHKTWVVTRFEFTNYITSKPFIITTLISCIIIFALLSLPSLSKIFSTSRAGDKGTIALAGESDPLPNLDVLQGVVPEYQLTTVEWTDEDSIFTTIAEQELSGVLLLKADGGFVWYCERMPFNEAPQYALTETIVNQRHAQTLVDLGLSAEEADAFIQGPDLQIVEKAQAGGKSQQQTQSYTYALVMLLYMTIMTYGQMTASSVASEKGTRTMEILITSTRPQNLLNGKVIGTGLAGLLQMAMFGLTYFLGYSLNRPTYGPDSFFSAEMNMPPAVFLMAIVIFILSYLSFAYIFASLGSLVSRVEEISQVLSPVMLIYILGFAVALASTFAPQKTWVMIVSLLPLVGPLTYFVRFAMISLSPLWIALPLILHISYLFVLFHLATRVYRRGVLNYGQGVSFRNVFQILKEDKETQA